MGFVLSTSPDRTVTTRVKSSRTEVRIHQRRVTYTTRMLRQTSPPGGGDGFRCSAERQRADAHRRERAQRAGRGVGQIPGDAADERTAVDHRDGALLARIEELDTAAARQRAVRDAVGAAGQLLAAGRAATVEAGAVLGGLLQAVDGECAVGLVAGRARGARGREAKVVATGGRRRPERLERTGAVGDDGRDLRPEAVGAARLDQHVARRRARCCRRCSELRPAKAPCGALMTCFSKAVPPLVGRPSAPAAAGASRKTVHKSAAI